MDKYVGLGEIQISSTPGDLIKTFALASCVGITAYCAKTHTAGMVHIVLPCKVQSTIEMSPSYYATTGVPFFIQKMLSCGCSKNDLLVRVYGGANSIKKHDFFNIGMRNLETVKDTLRQLHVPFTLADVGGVISRTLIMDVETGLVEVNALPICV
ncbi:MAG TPA: chemotaxis protein CheD [Ruminiclostridium sp.]|nr:chemotaxis protein CheD [Ruminiclostridium sp.]